MQRSSRSTLCAITIVGLAWLGAGCQVGDMSANQGGDDDDDEYPTPACDGPFGAARDPDALPACCTDFVGGAHCLPDETVPGVLRGRFAACAGGGTCVPDPFIATGGVYEPKTCTSLQGAEGVCLSGCIPQVQEVWGLLPLDVCDDDERCVPCVSPIDGMESGACQLKYTCEGGFGGGSATCPHTGPDLIDPTGLPSCGVGAHCLSAVLVPDEMRARLADCPGGGGEKCVPDDFIRAGGNFVPATCASVGGAEGRCLSTALPEIAGQAALLQRATCDEGELCAPCFHPLDQTDTGACHLSCDPGPTAGPMGLPACCDGRGTCVPVSAAGANAERLGQDTCTDETMVCAPNVFLQPGFQPATCETRLIQNLFGEQYAEGRCLPECLPDVQNFLIGQDGCAEGMKCAPCLKPPFGTESGACDPIVTGPPM